MTLPGTVAGDMTTVEELQQAIEQEVLPCVLHGELQAAAKRPPSLPPSLPLLDWQFVPRWLRDTNLCLCCRELVLRAIQKHRQAMPGGKGMRHSELSIRDCILCPTCTRAVKQDLRASC